MDTEKTALTSMEHRALCSLTKRRPTSWDRENMTAGRMFELQRKGMVARDAGRWKLTALGLLFASTGMRHG
ncbi:hypothetical protein ISP15_10275 [Dyella jejuensis]|uniref:Uncharacterized protein n=1 Tax=Dyella jejuensis TaxID=1432009 RepID=A0ABW8JHY8_9GAMM